MSRKDDYSRRRLASSPTSPQLNLDEQIARIEKKQTELREVMRETLKIVQDKRSATPQMLFHGALAMAAMIGAIAASATLFE